MVNDPENSVLERQDTGEKSDHPVYKKPAILFEFELEAQAGSPLNIDPLNLGNPP